MIGDITYYFVRNILKVQKVDFVKIFQEFGLAAALQFVTADKVMADLQH